MTSSLGPPLSNREVKRLVTKLAGGGIALIGIIVLVLGLGWLLLHLAWSPSLWKTEIGEVEIADHGALCIARAHDGDISYNYYAEFSVPAANWKNGRALDPAWSRRKNARPQLLPILGLLPFHLQARMEIKW